jgi:hypothetical protein
LRRAAGFAKLPGLFSWSCLRGDCCEDFRYALTSAFPRDTGYVAMYSRSDGVVDWRSCLDEAAQLVEVESSHCGMSVSAQVYREVGFALAAFGSADTDVGWAQAA